MHKSLYTNPRRRTDRWPAADLRLIESGPSRLLFAIIRVPQARLLVEMHAAGEDHVLYLEMVDGSKFVLDRSFVSSPKSAAA